MTILETQLVQRAYDGKWERIARVKDYENSYTHNNEAGLKTVLIPDKWITVKVYDFIVEIV
jgi:hypothetical protein